MKSLEVIKEPRSEVPVSYQHELVHTYRPRLNTVAGVINVAFEATARIEAIIASLDGLTVQASRAELPPSHRRALQTEANELRAELLRTVTETALEGVRPLAGDPASVDLKTVLGRSLEFTLPDFSHDSFGVPSIDFSAEQTRGACRSGIEEARRRACSLRTSIEQAQEQVKALASAIEVATQNSEASTTNIRDLDEAIKVAGAMKRSIGANPGGALCSMGLMRRELLTLLE